MSSQNYSLLSNIKLMLNIIAILWIVMIVSLFLPFLNKFGIEPRTLVGLVGIAAAPFLHAGFLHLITNTVILLVLGLILLSLEKKNFYLITVWIMLFGGLGTWLIGRSGAVHIGASGVVYGYLGYLLFIGIFTRNFKTILASIAVFLLYGGAVWGILPGGNPLVSWEAHLCGFASGILVAWTNAKGRK